MVNTQKKIDQLASRAYAQAFKNNSQQLTNLLTPKEKIVLGRRILIAQAILAGKTRSEVMALMQISPNTFTQIKHWLESELKEYTPATETPDTVSSPRDSRAVEPFSYQDLKRRYPGHFLLFSLTEELFQISKN